MRLHGLTDDLLPLLPARADDSAAWERLVDALIGLALRNRPLVELSLRNQEAIAEVHRHPEKHGAPGPAEAEERLLDLLTSRSLPTAERVRRVASLGALAAVLFAATALAGVPDSELETALRGVVHDVLGGRGS